LVLAALLRLEIRWDRYQAIVRWGAPPTPSELAPISSPVLPPPSAVDGPSPQVTELQQQILVLSELVQGLTAGARENAADWQAHERRQQQRLAALQSQLQDLKRQTTERWIATERDVAALSSNQTIALHKGSVP
jgi:hypothetical protein